MHKTNLALVLCQLFEAYQLFEVFQIFSIFSTLNAALRKAACNGGQTGGRPAFSQVILIASAV